MASRSWAVGASSLVLAKAMENAAVSTVSCESPANGTVLGTIDGRNTLLDGSRDPTTKMGTVEGRTLDVDGLTKLGPEDGGRLELCEPWERTKVGSYDGSTLEVGEPCELTTLGLYDGDTLDAAGLWESTKVGSYDGSTLDVGEPWEPTTLGTLDGCPLDDATGPVLDPT